MKTLFTNGEIWCTRGTYTDAVLVESGKVVAIGHDALQASNDEVIDLGGKFLAPGFIDAHAHPLFAGRESQGPNVNGLQSVAEIVAEVKRFAEANPYMPWIMGGAYEAAIVERGDFLTVTHRIILNRHGGVVVATDRQAAYSIIRIVIVLQRDLGRGTIDHHWHRHRLTQAIAQLIVGIAGGAAISVVLNLLQLSCTVVAVLDIDDIAGYVAAIGRALVEQVIRMRSDVAAQISMLIELPQRVVSPALIALRRVLRNQIATGIVSVLRGVGACRLRLGHLVVGRRLGIKVNPIRCVPVGIHTLNQIAISVIEILRGGTRFF